MKLALLLCPQLLLAAQTNLGLIGGTDNTFSAYAAHVSQDGTVTAINSLPTNNALIYTVAQNTNGLGLIGGIQNTDDAYAAFVTQSGVVSSLNSLPTNNALINSVAINNSGAGLIGGQIDSPFQAYAALVFPNGAVTSLPVPANNSIINSVAINDSGIGLIGGLENSLNEAYAAYVLPGGSLSALNIIAPLTSVINCVAINDSGTGLIGGQSNGPNDAYAALVTVGNVNPLTNLPTNFAYISSAAINASGAGLIGGIQNSDKPYAALVPAGGGNVIPLNTLPATSGSINSVAINASGTALIGGKYNFVEAYAALVSPGGNVISLSPLPTNNSVIYSVALLDSGAGLIAGQQNTNFAYAALVSPAGEIIPLSLPGSGSGIISVAFDSILAMLSKIPTNGLTGNNLEFAKYINKYAPQDAFYFVPAVLNGTLAEALMSAAPTRNAIALYTADNNLFYLNHALSNHLRNESHFRMRPPVNSTPTVALGLTPWKSEDYLIASLSDPQEPEQTPASCEPNEGRPYTLWFDGIGALSYQKSQKQTTAFNPSTGAALLGFDAVINSKSWVGGGAAYAYTHIHEKKDAGHSDINQEYLFVYGSFQGSNFYADGALWGGLFQIGQVRNIRMTEFDFKSTSHPHGWQLAPHMELGYNAINNNKLIVDPFVMLDWVAAWQNSYKEKGSGPFNAGQKDHYSSFLRTEIGARVFETISFDAWRLTFQEKASYVYKKSFNVGRVNAFLVGSPGSFTVETLTTPQNLGVGEFGMIFEPVDQRYPYGTIIYQGEFGSSSQSHQLSVELAWDF